MFPISIRLEERFSKRLTRYYVAINGRKIKYGMLLVTLKINFNELENLLYLIICISLNRLVLQIVIKKLYYALVES